LLFSPSHAAQNGRLLKCVVTAAREPGCTGLREAVADARQGLTRGGTCRLTLERACGEVRTAASSALQAAKLERTAVLEDGRMRQNRGRVALGCSRPVDVCFDVAAVRIHAVVAPGGQAVAQAQVRGLEDLQERVLAVHEKVRSLVRLLEALDGSGGSP
jgi:hypothetical protein